MEFIVIFTDNYEGIVFPSVTLTGKKVAVKWRKEEGKFVLPKNVFSPSSGKGVRSQMLNSATRADRITASTITVKPKSYFLILSSKSSCWDNKHVAVFLGASPCGMSELCRAAAAASPAATSSSFSPVDSSSDDSLRNRKEENTFMSEWIPKGSGVNLKEGGKTVPSHQGENGGCHHPLFWPVFKGQNKYSQPGLQS